MRVASVVDGAAAVDFVVPTLLGDVLHVGANTGMLPAGFGLRAPAVGAFYRASTLDVSGWSVPVFYLPTGEVLFGTILTQVLQVCPQTGGGAVVVGSQLQHIGPTGTTTLTRPAASFRRCLSGAGV